MKQIISYRRSESLFSHDVVEIFSRNLSSITGSSLQHFIELSGIHCLSQLLRDSFYVADINESSSIVIEKVKNLVDTVLKLIKCYSGLLITQSCGDTIKELFKINLSAFSFEVSDHVEDCWVLGLKAQ